METILDSKWHVFIKVAELNSLTRAAAAFDVPQSKISRHISDLERQCGARLFHRTGRGVRLTEFGLQLLPRIEALANQADQLEDDILTSGKTPMGEVRVGLLPSSVPKLASSLYSQVKDKFPRVQLHLCEGASASLEEQIAEGRIDMAILLREGDVSSSEESVLAQPRLLLVGLADDPLLKDPTVELAKIDGIPLVVPSRPHPLRARLENLARTKGLNIHCAVEADSIRLQHEVSAAGGGYAITSGLFELVGDNRLAASRIVKPELLRSVVLSQSIRRPSTLATREVQRLIEKVAPALLRP